MFLEQFAYRMHKDYVLLNITVRCEVCFKLEKTKPEKLILKIPRRLWKLLLRPSVAYCVTQIRAVPVALALIIVGLLALIYSYYVYVPLQMRVISIVLWIALFSPTILGLLPTIFIRKDCFECQLGFHIIAHEGNHLKLGSSEETVVEEETLRQTRDRLIPILLSNPKICKGCPFWLRKMYCHATFNYIKRK